MNDFLQIRVVLYCANNVRMWVFHDLYSDLFYAAFHIYDFEENINEDILGMLTPYQWGK